MVILNITRSPLGSFQRSALGVLTGLALNTIWSGNNTNKIHLTSGLFTSTIKDSLVTTTIGAGPLGAGIDGRDSLWTSDATTKLYKQSGQFSSTIKTSQSVAAAIPTDSTWDGTNTPWANSASKLMLQSGQFTSTLKTSLNVIGIATTARGISWNSPDTPWASNSKLYLNSGQFTSTIKTSQDHSTFSTDAYGMEASFYL